MIVSNSISITVPKPKYRSCTILFGENQHPMENPTQRSNLGPSRERTQKCLPLSPRPKSRLGPPNRFAERGKNRSRVRSSAPPPPRSAPPRVPARAAISIVYCNRACSFAPRRVRSVARSTSSFAGMDIAPTPADPPLEATYVGSGVSP